MVCKRVNNKHNTLDLLNPFGLSLYNYNIGVRQKDEKKYREGAPAEAIGTASAAKNKTPIYHRITKMFNLRFIL